MTSQSSAMRSSRTRWTGHAVDGYGTAGGLLAVTDLHPDVREGRPETSRTGPEEVDVVRFRITAVVHVVVGDHLPQRLQSAAL
jgi:hypothetical protein